MSRMMVALLLTGTMLVTEAAAQQRGSPQDAIIGTWKGRLEMPGLTLVFHIRSAPDGRLSATMDSPDQGATGVPTGEVTFADSVLRVTIPIASAEFSGRLRPDGTIAGEFRQGGAVPLILTRGAAAAPTRPQDPVGPAPYTAEDVTFANPAAAITLAGTFTRPTAPGRYPAVVLITGSGPQDRDEALAGHRPFLVLADHLTRNGIAVLRYDDRGYGKSSGSFATATSADFATDVAAAVAWLKQRTDVDPAKIGLIGHSEGGLIAPLVASRSADVAFIVMLAGPGVTGEEILYEQGRLIGRAAGTSAELLEKSTARQRQIFAAVKALPDTAGSSAAIRAIVRDALEAVPPAERAAAGLPADITPVIEAQTRQVTAPWFRWFLKYDPVPALERVTVPVLVLNGELDLQVWHEQNVPPIEAALKRANNRDVTIQRLPGLNHLFQTAKTGGPDEYARIDETMSPVVLKLMSKWINDRFGVVRD